MNDKFIIFSPNWNSKIFRRLKSENSTSLNEVCIFEFENFLLFTNTEVFKNSVEKTLLKWTNDNFELLSNEKLRYSFIFNFSSITSIDSTGLSALKEVISRIKETTGASIYFLNPKDFIKDILLKSGVVKDEDFLFSLDNFFAKQIEM